MLELSEIQLAAALANAAAFSGGILQSFADGTDEWRYQVGVAARLGLVAAARRGVVTLAATLRRIGDYGQVGRFLVVFGVKLEEAAVAKGHGVGVIGPDVDRGRYRAVGACENQRKPHAGHVEKHFGH